MLNDWLSSLIQSSFNITTIVVERFLKAHNALRVTEGRKNLGVCIAAFSTLYIHVHYLLLLTLVIVPELN